MNIDSSKIPFRDNEALHRFEIEVNGYIAFITYRKRGKHVALLHTEAAQELIGTGAAAVLAEKTFIYFQQQGFTILPYCPYLIKYIQKHPEWKPLVDSSFDDYDKL